MNEEKEDEILALVRSDGDLPIEILEVEPGSNVCLLSFKSCLASLLMDTGEYSGGNSSALRVLNYTVGCGGDFFVDFVLPVARELAGGKRVHVVDDRVDLEIGDDCFPVVVVSGEELTAQRLKRIIRMECATGLARCLADRMRPVLFYLCSLERTPEPVQPHLRSLLDGYFL